jgi:phosphopantothenoylcysteine decarboxylase/phosphopantothenate--cysteine ligase
MVIAPATANTIVKMANGTCDNLLLLIYLQSVLFFAPAMDMYKHPSTIATFKALHEFGNTIIPAESGVSGLSG